MSNKIKGTVLVSGQIAPSHENDLYPTHEDIFGKGGYSVVNDIADRDAISDERRKEGMAVYVKDVGEKEIIAKVYVLQGGIENANWVEWPFTSSITVENEGTELTTDVQKFNFTGDGVTATTSGNDVTVNIPGAEPEIITVKHTLDATDIVGISKPDGGSPYVLLPLQKESTTFYNIINIHCRFTGQGAAYNIVPTGEGDLIAMYFSTLDKSTGSIIPKTLLEDTGVKTFAYGNPLADSYRDNNLNSSWLPVDDFVIYSDYAIDDDKGTAFGTLEIWVTYTLTSLT